MAISAGRRRCLASTSDSGRAIATGDQAGADDRRPVRRRASARRDDRPASAMAPTPVRRAPRSWPHASSGDPRTRAATDPARHRRSRRRSPAAAGHRLRHPGRGRSQPRPTRRRRRPRSRIRPTPSIVETAPPNFRRARRCRTTDSVGLRHDRAVGPRQLEGERLIRVGRRFAASVRRPRPWDRCPRTRRTCRSR